MAHIAHTNQKDFFQFLDEAINPKSSSVNHQDERQYMTRKNVDSPVITRDSKEREKNEKVPPNK